MRALLIGHFSTVGDIEVLREVERRLAAIPMRWDVAPLSKWIARQRSGWLDVRTVTPSDYTHLFVVCGPFWRPDYIRHGIDLDAFAHCARIGVNLSMIESVDAYNPFDRLIGRDSDKSAQPDISFLHEPSKVPVAGLCLASAQSEYGDRQRHDKAADFLRRLADRNGLAVIPIDTAWPAQQNASGLASPEQFESICARLDVMLTTRLHGAVISLKNGVPVVAIDAISGGGKVLQQANAIGWSEAFAIDHVTDAHLDDALARCLHPTGRDRARSCTAAARATLAGFCRDFADAIQAEPRGKPSFTRPAQQPSRIQKRLRKIAASLVRYTSQKEHRQRSGA
jgi:hypothetical protein